MPSHVRVASPHRMIWTMMHHHAIKGRNALSRRQKLCHVANCFCPLQHSRTAAAAAAAAAAVAASISIDTYEGVWVADCRCLEVGTALLIPQLQSGAPTQAGKPYLLDQCTKSHTHELVAEEAKSPLLRLCRDQKAISQD